MPKPRNHLEIHCNVYNMSNIYRWLLQLSKNLQLVRHIQHTLRCEVTGVSKNYRNTSKFEVAITKVQVAISGRRNYWCLQKIHYKFQVAVTVGKRY